MKERYAMENIPSYLKDRLGKPYRPEPPKCPALQNQPFDGLHLQHCCPICSESSSFVVMEAYRNDAGEYTYSCERCGNEYKDKPPYDTKCPRCETNLRHLGNKT